MDLKTKQLLNDLHNPDEAIRKKATAELWKIWFSQKGLLGLQLLQEAQNLSESGLMQEAKAHLTKLVTDFPDFAEAWNQRAVFYYMNQEYYRSLADCQEVIKLIPYHFGALHGMGLCYASLEDYLTAIQFFRRALEIQPYAIINQRLILECTARLN